MSISKSLVFVSIIGLLLSDNSFADSAPHGDSAPNKSVVNDVVTDVISDTARETTEIVSTPVRDGSSVRCPRYKVFYIDPSAQFFTPPVPLEDHAEFVFCSDHENLDAIRTKLAKMKPIGSHADAGAARIKVVPNGKPNDAIIFCSTGEITYRGKQYRLDRRSYEPSLLSLREEGDRQRSIAIEREDDADPRGPASVETPLLPRRDRVPAPNVPPKSP